MERDDIKNLILQNKSITIDVGDKCPIQCYLCARQYNRANGIKPGFEGSRDLSLSELEVICNHFQKIDFCGQASDSIANPKFIEMLEMTRDHPNVKSVHVSTAATLKNKKEDWYRRAFEANPKASWTYALDGLPKDSHKYRVNQNGEFLYEMMLMGRKEYDILSIWQYIVFAYNEWDIKTAMKMAEDNDIIFELNCSSRWHPGDDNRPRKGFYKE